MKTTPGHHYELHKTNTFDVDKNGNRYRWCVYDYFNVSGQKGVSFWYFVNKKDAVEQYPSVEAA